MQEDKKLKELLIKYALEETSADFTNTVMQRIESAAAKRYATPLLKQKLLQLMVAAFVLVCVVLLALSIFYAACTTAIACFSKAAGRILFANHLLFNCFLDGDVHKPIVEQNKGGSNVN